MGWNLQSEKQVANIDDILHGLLVVGSWLYRGLKVLKYSTRIGKMWDMDISKIHSWDFAIFVRINYDVIIYLYVVYVISSKQCWGKPYSWPANAR